MTHIVIAMWTAKPGEDDYVAQVLQELTPINRAEPKMISFEAHRAVEEPTRFVLVERYTDASGYEDHRSGAPFQERVVGDLIPRLADRIVSSFTLIEP